MKKLKSEKGASITFALLLFLVCAVVSSIVMVSASTAGGRLSTIREMDQRYYAATAAAEVIREQLEGKTAVVGYTWKIEDGKKEITVDPSSTSDDLLMQVSKIAVTGSTTTVDLADEAKPITQTVNDVAYNCTIQGSLNSGMLFFKTAVTGGKFNQGTYTVTMVYSPNIMLADDSSTTGKGKAQVSWKMSSLQKQRINKESGGSGT